MKKFLSVILVLVLAMNPSNAVGAADVGLSTYAEDITTATPDSDFSWGYRGDGSGAVVMGYNGTAADVIIPSEVFVDGKIQKVVAIADSAFMNCNSIVSIKIPDSVIDIGESAFRRCSGLKSIVIPKGVTVIEEQTFEECTDLESVVIPDSVTAIGDGAFYECKKLADVVLSENLVTIGISAFENCTGLIGVVIPNSVSEIKKRAFYGCDSIEEITVGTGVRIIGRYALACSTPYGQAKMSQITFLGNDFEMPIDAIAQFGEFTPTNYYETIRTDVTIYGNKGQAAEVAAKRLGYTFTTLDGSESTDYSQVKGCTDVTAGLYDAYSDFLTEYYIQKFPDAALEPFSCTEEEHEFFKILTKTIIDENPGENIPETLYNWMNSNISSKWGEAGYPIDVYRYKTADCVGNAFLLCELLRCADIPAVVATGIAGDFSRSMNNLAEYNIFSKCINGSEIDGHEWVFYYCNGQWNVADSGMDIFTSERNIIANHYYICSVDGLAVNSDYYSPLASDSYRLIENGTFINNDTNMLFQGSGGNIYINPEGIFYNWSGEKQNWFDTGEEVSQAFGEEGWIVDNRLQYLKKNGYLKIHGVEERDGKKYWLAQNSVPYDISDAPVDSYFFGCPVFKVGDKFNVSYLDNDSTPRIYTYSLLGDPIAEIDSDGVVTIVGEGHAEIWIDAAGDNRATASPFEFFAFDPEAYKNMNLMGTSFSANEATLSWDMVDNATNYVIKRLVDGVWIDVIMTDGDVDSVEISELTSGEEYLFGIDVIAQLGSFGNYRFTSEDIEAVTAGVKSENTFTYVNNADGTITITGGKIYDSEVTIPDIIDGKKVSGIAEKAFEGCAVMKQVTVPETVALVSDKALGFDNSGNKYPDITLKGHENSAIYYYAMRYDIPFEIIGKTSEENLPFKEENAKQETVETDVDIPAYVKPEDRITSITINPAFNMKNKDESGVALDLTQIKIKAKEIYSDDDLKRAEEVLGTELVANKHYNLLDLTLIMDNGNDETDISKSYEGLVEVRIPIPKGHKDKTFYCYRINSDNTKEVIPGMQTEDCYIVYLEHFSLYALIADENNNTAVEITIKSPENVDTSNRTVTIVGDSVNKSVEITDGTIDFSGIVDGSYKFTFLASNCAPRAYDVTVSGSTVTGLENGVELHLYGDIDGDGKVNMKDVGKANAHAKNTARLSDYDLSVSDINGDGKINMQDVGLMNAHAKNTKSLWK